MNNVKKVFNWKAALSILFTAAVIFRACTWLFGSDIPTCGSTKTRNMLEKRIDKELTLHGYTNVKSSMSNAKEIFSSSKVRGCTATFTATDKRTGESDSAIYRYELTKTDSGIHYRIAKR